MFNNKGFTLVEIIIATFLLAIAIVAILGIIVVGFHQTPGTSLSAYEHTRNKQDLLTQARWAMKRIRLMD